jgi:hypothetical protein
MLDGSPELSERSERELRQRQSLAKLLSALKEDPMQPSASYDQEFGISTLSPPLERSEDSITQGYDDQSLLSNSGSSAGDAYDGTDFVSDDVGLRVGPLDPPRFESGAKLETEVDALGSQALLAEIIAKSARDVQFEKEAPSEEIESPPRRHKLDLHSSSASNFPDVRLHSNVKSSFAQTMQHKDSSQDSGSNTTKDSLSGSAMDHVGMLFKAIYYDGVLPLSLPMRPIAMALLILCVAGLSFCFYWVKPMDNDRRRYTHKGRTVYEWQDTPEVAILYTKLPKGLTSKGLDIKIWPRHLKMGRSGKQAFIREELFSSVVVEECTWEVSDGELALTLCKDAKVSWPCVFRAHNPGKATTLL